MKNNFDKIKRAVQELSMMVFEYSEQQQQSNRKASIRRLLSFDRLSPNEQERSALDALRLHFPEDLPPMRNTEVLQPNNTVAEDMEKGIVKFNEKEINTMPKNLKRLIIIQKKRCRLRMHQSGKNTVTYEIRFRCDGYDVSACGKTIELAKEHFIKKFKTAKPKSDDSTGSVPTTFNAFAMYYFETFRREKVASETYLKDMSRYKKHMQPFFSDQPLKKILPADCKLLLDKLKNQGLCKTADEIYSLMNVIFKSAIAHGILERNPLDIVQHTLHETESGTALSKLEEKMLKESGQYVPWFMFMLYTGLRPNEFASAKIDGQFIVAVNSKRKTKKIQYKRIPILKGLREFLPLPAIKPPVRTLREKIKEILPNHILYDLRTTFHSRCIEYKVDEIARKLFMGHSLGKLTQAYTDLSDEYFINESKKLDEW